MARTSPANGLPRILVVDDEPNIADVISSALRYESYEVAVAARGEEALRAAIEFRPHLVVLDVLLPDFNGFEVTRRLRDAGYEAPILFLSASDSTDHKARGLEAGADDYMTKPFSIEDLLIQIATLLGRCEEGGGLRSQGSTKERRKPAAP